MFYMTGIEMDLGLCRAVIAIQEVKSETSLPQVDNSHDLKELNVVSQDNERHQLGIEFNNQLPPAAAVSNKNHHSSVVDLASRSQSSFAETTNVDFSREVVPVRAEVSPKNMAQEIVDAAFWQEAWTTWLPLWFLFTFVSVSHHTQSHTQELSSISFLPFFHKTQIHRL